MKYQNFRRNYSENDLKSLINERTKKAEYINKILDNSIHTSMISESNPSSKNGIKYIKNNYVLMNKVGQLDDINKTNNSIYQSQRNKNKILTNEYIISNNNYSSMNRNNSNYTMNSIDPNYIYNNSIINKPLHCEKRHFPHINNSGNFFRNINPFLVGNTNTMNNNLLHEHNNQRTNSKIYMSKIKNENNKKVIEFPSIKRSGSMANLPLNSYNININNNYNNSYNPKISRSMRNEESKHYKYYIPKRYDYEGSRYGDNTYNYYLNSPMRSDVSSNWRFPPLYFYNSNKEN